MNTRFLLVASLTAAALSLSGSSHAHDPRLHFDEASTPTAKPETCTQLADTERYSNDVTDPDIKALKTRCEVEESTDANPTDDEIK